jgi:hypothetical protein
MSLVQYPDTDTDTDTDTETERKRECVLDADEGDNSLAALTARYAQTPILQGQSQSWNQSNTHRESTFLYLELEPSSQLHTLATSLGSDVDALTMNPLTEALLPLHITLCYNAQLAAIAAEDVSALQRSLERELSSLDGLFPLSVELEGVHYLPPHFVALHATLSTETQAALRQALHRCGITMVDHLHVSIATTTTTTTTPAIATVAQGRLLCRAARVVLTRGRSAVEIAPKSKK